MKISIIGAGNVGATIAHTLLHSAEVLKAMLSEMGY